MHTNKMILKNLAGIAQEDNTHEAKRTGRSQTAERQQNDKSVL